VGEMTCSLKGVLPESRRVVMEE